MTDIATLRADVRSWLTRSDITSAQIATALRLFEAELSRTFFPRVSETLVELSVPSSPFDLTTAGAGGTDLRVQKIRAITDNSDASNAMIELTPYQLRALDFSRRLSQPTHFAQEGTSLIFAPENFDATTPGSFSMLYFQRPLPLDDANPTHLQLAQFYDLYLLGCLKHVCQLLQDMERSSSFAAQYGEALVQTRNAENRARLTNNPITAFRNISEVI